LSWNILSGEGERETGYYGGRKKTDTLAVIKHVHVIPLSEGGKRRKKEKKPLAEKEKDTCKAKAL
jgi:hypothetical protein